MTSAPVVAIEIGSCKVLALVGERQPGGHIVISGIGRCRSSGVRKGEIVGFDNAVEAVRMALDSAEQASKHQIRQVYLTTSGGHVQSLVNRGTVPLGATSREVTAVDVAHVMEVAKAVHLPPEREKILTICQCFCVDDQERVQDPEGLEGLKLSVDMLVLHGLASRFRNTVRVIKTVQVDVAELAFSGLCSALAVLTPEQKKSGVIVIDLGGGTTDYLAYAGGALAAAGCIGVGGDHVSHDIAMCFNIPLSQAERLKKEAGSAVVELGSSSQRITVSAELGFPGCTIGLKSLNTVINARMDETLGMIAKRLEADRISQRAAAGVVLTGGGAHMRGICRLVEQIFKVSCHIGRPRNVTGLATATEGPEFAACVGMLQLAYNIIDEEEPAGAAGSVLKRVARWFGW